VIENINQICDNKRSVLCEYIRVLILGVLALAVAFQAVSVGSVQETGA
jgi:hypothetical protein